MTVREKIENNEKLLLSDKACLNINSKGRKIAEEKCSIRAVSAQIDTIIKGL